MFPTARQNGALSQVLSKCRDFATGPLAKMNLLFFPYSNFEKRQFDLGQISMEICGDAAVYFPITERKVGQGTNGMLVFTNRYIDKMPVRIISDWDFVPPAAIKI